MDANEQRLECVKIAAGFAHDCHDIIRLSELIWRFVDDIQIEVVWSKPKNEEKSAA